MWNTGTPPLSCHREITLSKIDEMYPKPDLHNINISMHISKWEKICWDLHKLLFWNENMGVSWANNSVKIDKICPLLILNQIFTVAMHIPFGENPLIFTCYHTETKILTCHWPITLSKIYENCPLAIPNQICTIPVHTPSLVKIQWYLLKVLYGNEKPDVMGR